MDAGRDVDHDEGERECLHLHHTGVLDWLTCDTVVINKQWDAWSSIDWIILGAPQGGRINKMRSSMDCIIAIYTANSFND